MIGVQREITERAIELLKLDSSKPAFVLDIGCGSGLSGKVLEERGHVWVGCDISRDMLEVAKERMIENDDDDESDDDDEVGTNSDKNFDSNCRDTGECESRW